MKFGHNLPRNQVPEWASAYINYKGLKKLIKAAAQTAKDGKEEDLAGTHAHAHAHAHAQSCMIECLELAHADHRQNSSIPSIAT
jgi:hypothetical protein